MSLLKKFIAANPIPQGREIEYVKVINAVPSKPADVDGDMKARMCVTIELGGAQSNVYLFKDAIFGLPTFIPKGGVQAMLTVQLAKDINPKDGKPYINAVALGVGV